MAFADGTVWGPAKIRDNLDRWIQGTDAGERLLGTDGDDFITGGGGDDTLEDGGGSDTYFWNLGDGNDTILDYREMNLLRFGEGIAPEKLRVERRGSDLVLTVGESGETVTVPGWFLYRRLTVEFVRNAICFWSRRYTPTPW